MEQHNIDIHIARDGEVTVSVHGAKGKTCLKYAAFLAEVVGKVKDQKHTSEYYEPETRAGLDITIGDSGE